MSFILQMVQDPPSLMSWSCQTYMVISSGTLIVYISGKVHLLCGICTVHFNTHSSLNVTEQKTRDNQGEFEYM